MLPANASPIARMTRALVGRLTIVVTSATVTIALITLNSPSMVLVLGVLVIADLFQVPSSLVRVVRRDKAGDCAHTNANEKVAHRYRSFKGSRVPSPQH